MKYGTYDINDADGDGVEDNAKLSRDDVDNFFYPNMMGDAGMDTYNTRNGEQPGLVNKEFYDK